ncbi:FAD-dependent monooxygenase [Rhodosalinus sediminis]|uniref:FAD-dependent monooxygenase n=1 Tax=Rhodosalinus sediminis TaxID=1940533 RepID=UPI002355BF67|nr:FAD-dependent monooxygenase [Rhodosalinus sediminis]
MSTDTDILIAGGGLTGTALALALARAGRHVTLIDPAPVAARAAEGFDGRSYALALASVRMLRALGLGGTIADHGQPMLEIRISDGRANGGPSPLWLEFHHAEIEEGPMGHMVEDRHLRRALLEAVAAEPRIDHRAGEAVTDHVAGPASVTVTLSSGARVSGRLLAACDGVRSPTARRAGIRRTGWRYGQTALVCALAHEKPHHGVAHQFFMPEGPLAILPLPGDRCSIVWTERDARATAIDALDDAGYLAALRPRFGDFLGEITLAGTRYTYPLELSLAQSFTDDRLALVGDAAHRVHPIAGQGLNAGLRDVAALAEVIGTAATRGEDIGAADVLDRYARWRRFDTAALAAATDGVNRLFSNDNPVVRLGRDLGLGAVAHLPRLRRGFIREAAGLTGALPELMRG